MNQHNFIYDLPVDPPDHPDQILWLRKSVGSQRQCAALAGVNVSSWKQYEAGTLTPSASVWGLFLLAIDQHPGYCLPARRKLADIYTDPGVFDL